MTNVQCFALGEKVLLSKDLEAHPRQMQRGIFSFHALQVKASPSICDTSFSKYTGFFFQLTAVSFKIY